MDNIREKIEELTLRINQLSHHQTNISSKLIELINELDLLKKQVAATESIKEEPVKVPEKVVEYTKPIEAPVQKKVVLTPIEKKQPKASAPKTTSSFEEFIGKNIASKVGILVTIVGVFIGAKYAIDHNLVSPIVRIGSGYLCGAALVAIGIRLKKKYEGYSSVLMGGGIAVLYFITYIAYSFYGLIPQIPAFGLMLLFTVGTVYASLWYNRVIIAHLGLVGAYAIPFLLSDNSGRVEILFSYVALINAGILILSFRKYWKSLFYAAFIVTWLIFSAWLLFDFNRQVHFSLALIFLCIFFITFYATFLAYKLVKKEQYNFSDVSILLSNSFIFYGFGYYLLSHRQDIGNYLGLFTIVNALIHLTVSQVIRKLKLADTTLYYFILGLVVVFFTIAIPVQLDGDWVTLLWTAEAVMVFIIGRTRKSGAYEKIASALIVLSFMSLWQDWVGGFNTLITDYENKITPTPFLSISFATGLLVCIAQAAIIYVNRNKKYVSALPDGNLFREFYNVIVPILLLTCGYFVFIWELAIYFDNVQAKHGNGTNEIISIGGITYLLYTLLFWLLVMAINRSYIRNKALSAASLIIVSLIFFILLVVGLPVLNNGAYAYYFAKEPLYFGILNLVYRYVILAVVVALLYMGRQTMHELTREKTMHNLWSIAIHIVALSFISAEYLNWTKISGADNQYKLGLSIVWGLYALFLIVLGIWKKKKHLRLSAIILFSVILIKLFVYDLAEAGTITKTISFISLGVILLVVSYLYNRYKEILFGDDVKASS